MVFRELVSDHSLSPSIDRLRREFDRWVDYAMTQGGRAADAAGLTSGTHFPPVNVIELPDEILVTVDLPGIDPGSIELTLAGHMLTLHAGIPVHEPADSETFHRRERRTGEYQRSIPLPIAVDPDSVSARSQHGVLEVRIAKSAQLKRRSIEIQKG